MPFPAKNSKHNTLAAGGALNELDASKYRCSSHTIHLKLLKRASKGRAYSFYDEGPNTHREMFHTEEYRLFYIVQFIHTFFGIDL